MLDFDMECCCFYWIESKQRFAVFLENEWYENWDPVGRGTLRTQTLGYYFRRLKHMCTRLRLYLDTHGSDLKLDLSPIRVFMHLAFGSRLLQGMNRSTNASDWTNRETCGGDEKVKRALNGSDLKPTE